MNDVAKSAPRAHFDLAALRGEQNWAALWQHAIPLVRKALRRMERDGEVNKDRNSAEEAEQQGMLIAGEAMRTWDPIECAFSTYVMGRVRWELLHHIQEEHNGGVGSYKQSPTVVSIEDERAASLHQEYDENDEEDDGASFGAVLTYQGVCRAGNQFDGDGAAPEGFGDPLDEAAKLESEARIRAAVEELPRKLRNIVKCVGGFGTRPETVEQYATRIGVDRATAFRRIAAAQTKLRLNRLNFPNIGNEGSK